MRSPARLIRAARREEFRETVKPARHILVVGQSECFNCLFAQLEGRGYHFEQVADSEAARTYLLRQVADLLLLSLPSRETESRAALAWLRTIKEQFPVVVISCLEEVRPYLAAMEVGAFDYLTCHTPLEEFRRVLENAVRGRQHQAA